MYDKGLCVSSFFEFYASLDLIVTKCCVGKMTYRHFSGSPAIRKPSEDEKSVR